VAHLVNVDVESGKDSGGKSKSTGGNNDQQRRRVK
jgi:hypothetical protein